jgi:hypothetical protein
LSEEPDSFKWLLITIGVYTVECMYTDFINGHTFFLQKYCGELRYAED